ncbi:hypothetical protein FB567DRAFT_548644 [Paraphoma chrysanthemicola]|uniref:Uncharacterized protein n=1 Tax=Paraphoma chrysanthemicola TaxID=798071 RepID=A0A8K0VZB2_9PLEO|nr:hypothetical protein FB567DRAFT_548644 [Paraphoma chrysanthemicola]
MSTTISQPTGFFDLPKELRLMIYEIIPSVRVHHAIRLHGKGGKTTDIVLVKDTPAFSIRLTCRRIESESRAIFKQWAHNSIPRHLCTRSDVHARLIMRRGDLHLLAGTNSFLNKPCRWYKELEKSQDHRLYSDTFATRERMTHLDTELLAWIKHSGERMLRDYREIQVEVEPDPSRTIPTRSELREFMHRSDIAGSLGSMASRFDLVFFIRHRMQWAPPATGPHAIQWWFDQCINNHEAYECQTDVAWPDWHEREWL